jgi:MIP family channel proteins
VDDDRHRREEEARREAEERRRDDPLFDYEWRDIEGNRTRRSSRSERDPSEAERGQDHSLDRVREPDREPVREPVRTRRRSSVRDQTTGLYGSRIGANMLRTAVAELVGTFILVFSGTAVATAAILQRPTAGPYYYDSLAVALAFGLALAAVVAAIGHVSGAHVNPAVTLGLAVTNKFPWEHVPFYIGAQLLGAILGAIGTWIAYGGAARQIANVAATYPQPDVGGFQAFLVEFLVTFILVFVVLSVATDERVPVGVAPLAVGFALALGVFIAGPVTGGAVNPARALGPMIVAVRFTAAWVYILGPIAGGALAALLYDRFISEAETPE